LLRLTASLKKKTPWSWAPQANYTDLKNQLNIIYILLRNVSQGHVVLQWNDEFIFHSRLFSYHCQSYRIPCALCDSSVFFSLLSFDRLCFLCVLFDFRGLLCKRNANNTRRMHLQSKQYYSGSITERKKKKNFGLRAFHETQYSLLGIVAVIERFPTG
jgi:hypothetical protein